jgi:hypothetical protein
VFNVERKAYIEAPKAYQAATGKISSMSVLERWPLPVFRSSRKNADIPGDHWQQQLFIRSWISSRIQALVAFDLYRPLCSKS